MHLPSFMKVHLRAQAGDINAQCLSRPCNATIQTNFVAYNRKIETDRINGVQ